MGRIKTKLVKRVSLELFRSHESKFANEFEANKTAINGLLDHPNKKLRNSIAGYVTRMMKNRETA